MGLRLFLVHVSRADRPDQGAPTLRPPSENHKETTPGESEADRAKTALVDGVRGVRADERRAQKQALDFMKRDAVLFTFSAIAGVPIETIELHGALQRRAYIYAYANVNTMTVGRQDRRVLY
jgi:hypothetical protein